MYMSRASWVWHFHTPEGILTLVHVQGLELIFFFNFIWVLVTFPMTAHHILNWSIGDADLMG